MGILAETNLTLPWKKPTKLPCYDEKPGYNFLNHRFMYQSGEDSSFPPHQWISVFRNVLFELDTQTQEGSAHNEHY